MSKVLSLSKPPGRPSRGLDDLGSHKAVFEEALRFLQQLTWHSLFGPNMSKQKSTRQIRKYNICLTVRFDMIWWSFRFHKKCQTNSSLSMLSPQITILKPESALICDLLWWLGRGWAPVITTTLVVPSPTSLSWALLMSTRILAAGWTSVLTKGAFLWGPIWGPIWGSRLHDDVIMMSWWFHDCRD